MAVVRERFSGFGPNGFTIRTICTDSSSPPCIDHVPSRSSPTSRRRDQRLAAFGLRVLRLEAQMVLDNLGQSGRVHWAGFVQRNRL